MYLIKSINTNSLIGKVAFGLVQNAKSLEFVDGTVKLHGTSLSIIMLYILPHLF